MSKFVWVFGLFLLTGCLGRIPNCEDADLVPEWDHNAETRVITVTRGGGLEAPVSTYNRIPQAVVWGDGRNVWQTRGDDGERLVWQGQLSEEEMTAVLQTFVDKRFFCMDTHYAPKAEVFDGTSTSLTVSLVEKRYSVGEYVSGAPREFYELGNLAAGGAAAKSEPYVPSLGFLEAYQLSTPPDDGLPVWDESTGLVLADAADGVWLEGAALIQAWEIVNLQYWQPLVVQDGVVYELYLQIPDLTGREEPGM